MACNMSNASELADEVCNMSSASESSDESSVVDEHNQEQCEKEMLKNVTEVLEIKNSFRESNTFCDVILITDDGNTISAHKVVIGSASTVCLSMLKNTAEEECDEFMYLNIKDIDADILEIIVKYMYTFQLDLKFIDTNNIEKILRAANFFNLDNVKNLCCDFIENNINLDNSLCFMECAELISFKRLYDLSFAYILKHFSKLETSILSYLTCEQFTIFISSNNLETESEEQVYNFVLEWVKFDIENRKEFIPELMKHIRWPFVSKSFLFKVLNDPLVKVHNECLFLLVETLMIHLAHSDQPSYLSDLSFRGKRRLPLINKPDVIVSINNNYTDMTKNVAFYLDISDPSAEWKSVPSNIIPPNTYSRIIALDNGILLSICGKNSNKVVTNEVFMFDVSNYLLNWTQTASTKYERIDFAVCTDQKYVYVVGGIDNDHQTLDTIEYFDTDTKQWNLLGNMEIPRSQCSAVVHKNILYIIGGRDANDVCTTLIECYDLSLNGWIDNLLPLPQAIDSTSVTFLNNTIYVIGGVNPNDQTKNNCLNTVYAFDLQNSEWVCLKSMKSSRKNAGVAIVNEKQLYVVGGLYLNEKYIDDNSRRGAYNFRFLEKSRGKLYYYNCTTEIYDIKKNKWYSYHAKIDGKPCYPNLILWNKNFINVLLQDSK